MVSISLGKPVAFGLHQALGWLWGRGYAERDYAAKRPDLAAKLVGGGLRLDRLEQVVQPLNLVLAMLADGGPFGRFGIAHQPMPFPVAVSAGLPSARASAARLSSTAILTAVMRSLLAIF